MTAIVEIPKSLIIYDQDEFYKSNIEGVFKKKATEVKFDNLTSD